MVEKIEKSNDKIVVLNSGGFDSIVLVNYLAERYVPEAIHSLHFRYGARNEKQQEECVNKVCKKLGIENRVIDLPKFDWTSSRFYDEGFSSLESQYLEYRNLIFLSYAISYAESIGAKFVYVAIMKGSVVDYVDANPSFVDRLNATVQGSGISILAPFMYFSKESLLFYATQYKVLPDDFFSCDVPTPEGKACGVCSDCESLEHINKVLTPDTPQKIKYLFGDYSKEFSDYFFNMPVTKAVIKIGDTHLYETPYEDIVKKLIDYGINHISFVCKSRGSSITRAYTVIHDFLESNCEFQLTIVREEDYESWKPLKASVCLRDCGFKSLKLIPATERNAVSWVSEILGDLNTSGVSVSVDFELTPENTYWVLSRQEDMCSHRTLDHINYSLGYGKHCWNDGEFLLDKDYLNKIWEDVKSVSKHYKAINFNVLVGDVYLEEIYGTQLEEDLRWCEKMFTKNFEENLTVESEEYTSSFSDTIYVSHDGYVFGDSESFNTLSSSLAVGNLNDDPLKRIVSAGKYLTVRKRW